MALLPGPPAIPSQRVVAVDVRSPIRLAGRTLAPQAERDRRPGAGATAFREGQ